MKNKNSSKSLWVFIIILLVVIILWFGYLYATNIWVQKRFALEVKPYTTDLRLNYDLKCPYDNNSDIKKDLDKLFNAGVYFYREKDMPTGIGANVNFTFRLVTMNKFYLGYKNDYTFFLAHELTHLKYYSANECFVEYKAIITLYESGNDYFKNIALWRANGVLLGNIQDEYDCGYYLLEYFNK